MAIKTRMRHVLMVSGGESAGTRVSQPVVYRSVSGTPAPSLLAPVLSLRYVSLNPIILEFSATLHSGYVPATSAFSVVKNGSAAAVSSLTIDGTSVHLTLAVNLLVSDTLTVEYVKPTTNTYLRDRQGNAVASFGPIDVRNTTLSGALSAFQGNTFQIDAFQI